MYTLRKEDFNTKTMVKISVLGVISLILMLLDFPPLWFTPPFIKFDVSDVPSLIGGAFALGGPMAGVIIQLVKNLLKILVAGTNTVVVGGEVANFIVGSVFAYTAGLIYYREKPLKCNYWANSRYYIYDCCYIHIKLLCNDSLLCKGLWYALR